MMATEVTAMLVLVLARVIAMRTRISSGTWGAAAATKRPGLDLRCRLREHDAH